jgi:hypothetical protein
MSKEKRDPEYDALSLPDKCLVHRYRYYVMSKPLESDMVYDLFESTAKERGIPEGHALLEPGSSKENDYPKKVISVALGLDSWYNKWYKIKQDK